MFSLQFFDEVDAEVDARGFEVDEVESPAIVGRVDLPSEVNELCQRAADLRKKNHMARVSFLIKVVVERLEVLVR